MRRGPTLPTYRTRGAADPGAPDPGAPGAEPRRRWPVEPELVAAFCDPVKRSALAAPVSDEVRVAAVDPAADGTADVRAVEAA